MINLEFVLNCILMTSLSSSLTAHQLFFCAMFVILFSLLLVSCQQVTRARLFQFYVREGRAAKAAIDLR